MGGTVGFVILKESRSVVLSWGLMSAATLLTSTFPLVLHLTVAGDLAVNPFWWATAVNLGEVMFLVSVLWFARGWRDVSEGPRGWFRWPGSVRFLPAPLVWMVASRVGIPVFVLATLWVDTVVVAAAQNMIPLFLVGFLLVVKLVSGLRFGGWLVLSALVGVGLVAAGQAGGWGPLFSVSAGSAAMVGVGLALVGSAGIALSMVLNLLYGVGRSGVGDTSGAAGSEAVTWWTVAALAGSCAAMLPVNVLLGWWLFPPVPLVGSVTVTGFLLGAFVVASSSAAIRVANVFHRSVGVNSLLLLAGPLGIVWLLVVGVSVLRLDLFLFGAGLLTSVVWVVHRLTSER